jgi:peroxiredoxin
MKRKILTNLQFIIFCLVVWSCQEHHDYHINGNLKGIPDGTVIQLGILYENVGTPIATDTLRNGKFSFSDSIGNILLRMNLRIQDSKNYAGQCNFWVNNSDIEVSGSSKYLSQWKVKSNIKEQKIENVMMDQSRDLRIAADSLRLLRMDPSQTDLTLKDIAYKIRSINKSISDKELTYLKTNYNSLISVMTLNQIAQSGDSSQMKILKAIYPKLDTLYSNTLWGDGLKNLLSKVIPPSIGNKFVDFSAKDLQGVSHKLSDYKDKYVLLDFGMMACHGCMEAAADTRRLSEKYKKNLYVIGINLDTRKEFWEMATKRDSITWINLSDGKGTFGGAFTTYGIEEFPTYILIDPQGILIERWTGSENEIYFAKISKYLATKD